MHKLTLLYAEDDPQSRKNYAFVLEEYFSKVYIAEDGREALDIYHDKKPDVLLLDISMPFMDGLEVAKAVREENKEIPIIMLTAHSEQTKLMRAVNLKLEEYLLKPINDGNLRKVILKVINEIQNRDIILLKEKLEWNKTNSNLLYEEESIKLTKKEKKLMTLLINSIGEYFTHDTLIIQIWDDEIPDASHDNKLHQLVYRLNRKINGVTNSDTPLIENSYTLGYRLDYYS
jgi:DNA-binding response OmpR family regulator